MNNKNPSLIRWTRSDTAKLSSAVRQFNKKVKELDKLSEENYFPDVKSYQELKTRIVSRKELNRVIRSLKRFNQERQQQKVVTEGGQELTRWEQREINLSERRAIRNLTLEKFKIETGRKSIGMGDKRIREIDSTIESFEKLRTKKGYEFERVKNRVLIEGTSDRELYKAKIFQENFYKALEELKNYDNYDVLKQELDKYKNPLSFYNKVKDSDILSDIFKWYRGEDGEILIYGGFESSQEAFNTAIEVDLGLDLKE